jgi:hypothetical protein
MGGLPAALALEEPEQKKKKKKKMFLVAPSVVAPLILCQEEQFCQTIC